MRSAKATRVELLQLVDRGAEPSSDDPAPAQGRPVRQPGPEDFSDFYRRELPGLVVLSRALAGAAVAEDVAQEAMLVVCRRWDHVQRLESPVGWLRGVCMHKAVSLVRRRSLETRLLRRVGRVPQRPEEPGESDVLWELVRTLPDRQAQAVALHYALDLTVADVAVAMGCAEGTVKAHLARARAALAQIYAADEEVAR